MGQKIIPTSLRLNKKKNWDSTWTIDKNEYPNLLHFDIEVRKYFENIFNYKKIKLIKLNILKISKNINIYIYIYQNKKNVCNLTYNKIIHFLSSFYSNNNIKVFIRNFKLKNFKLQKKKILYILKKNKQIHKGSKKMIYIFSYALYTKNTNIIANYIKQLLEKKKHHKKQIKKVNNILEQFYKIFKNFKGYSLQFKGRLNGKKRKTRLKFQKGKIPFSTLNSDIKFNLSEFKTPSGICSIKLLMFFKK